MLSIENIDNDVAIVQLSQMGGDDRHLTFAMPGTMFPRGTEEDTISWAVDLSGANMSKADAITTWVAMVRNEYERHNEPKASTDGPTFALDGIGGEGEAASGDGGGGPESVPEVVPGPEASVEETIAAKIAGLSRRRDVLKAEIEAATKAVEELTESLGGVQRELTQASRALAAMMVEESDGRATSEVRVRPNDQ